MLKATLTFVKRKETLAPATAVAQLDADDIDFLDRHVQELRKTADAEDALLTRFQHGSGIPALLKQLLSANAAQFVGVSNSLANRLQASMDQATKPAPGVLAVIVSGPDQMPDFVTVLKLDAISEAASFELIQGQVKLSVLRDLLPAPGQLQKGISWPDPRQISDTIVIDRNRTAAQYFFNAFELQVSATPSEAEKALGKAIIEKVPNLKLSAAMQYAGSLSGRADEVAAKVKKQYPEVEIDLKELGGGGAVSGFIRPNKVAARNKRYSGDGIIVSVPADRLDRITGPTEVAGGWQLTVRFTTKPKEESS